MSCRIKSKSDFSPARVKRNSYVLRSLATSIRPLFRRYFSTGEQSLDHIKRHRDKEDRDSRGGDHSADDGRAEHATGDGARAAGKPKRQKPEDESKGSHQDRAKTQASAFKRSIEERFALLVFILREFNDQNRIFSANPMSMIKPICA